MYLMGKPVFRNRNFWRTRAQRLPGRLNKKIAADSRADSIDALPQLAPGLNRASRLEPLKLGELEALRTDRVPKPVLCEGMVMPRLVAEAMLTFQGTPDLWSADPGWPYASALHATISKGRVTLRLSLPENGYDRLEPFMKEQIELARSIILTQAERNAWYNDRIERVVQAQLELRARQLERRLQLVA